MTQAEFYQPKAIQEGFDSDNAELLETGEIDPISLLFSDANLPAYPQTIESVNEGNPYNISFTGRTAYY